MGGRGSSSQSTSSINFTDKELEALKHWVSKYNYEIKGASVNLQNSVSDLREKVETLENFIERTPDFEGYLFRGMRIPQEKFDDLTVGKVINQEGIASWSKDSGISVEFSVYSNHQQGVPVLFRVKGLSKTGDISSFNVVESEVISSAKSRQVITDISTFDTGFSDKIYVIDVEDYTN